MAYMESAFPLADLGDYVALISQVAKFGSLCDRNSPCLALMALKSIRIDY